MYYPRAYYPARYYPERYHPPAAPAPPGTPAGVRSMLAFWMGGACATPTITVEFPTGPIKITLGTYVPSAVLGSYNARQKLGSYQPNMVLHGEIE